MNIDMLIDGILDSYDRYGGINRSEAENFPNRQNVITVLQDLQCLIFPGFRVEEDISPTNIRYITGTRVNNIIATLTKEIQKALVYTVSTQNGNTNNIENSHCFKLAEHTSLALLEELPEIKRKITVNDNINLNTFCKAIITSMQGSLVHGYIIRINGEYLDNDTMKKHNLNYLDLKEKKKFKLLYDLGDNWQFNITTSKIYKGHKEKSIEVLSGKGYGIIEDCGGPLGLQFIFNGTSEEFEYQDINEFNIDEINKNIEKYQ